MTYAEDLMKEVYGACEYLGEEHSGQSQRQVVKGLKMSTYLAYIWGLAERPVIQGEEW